MNNISQKVVIFLICFFLFLAMLDLLPLSFRIRHFTRGNPARAKMDEALSNLIKWKVSLPLVEGWNWKSFKVPFNPDPSVILCNAEGTS